MVDYKMLDYVLLIIMTALAAVSFYFLFKAGPSVEAGNETRVKRGRSPKQKDKKPKKEEQPEGEIKYIDFTQSTHVQEEEKYIFKQAINEERAGSPKKSAKKVEKKAEKTTREAVPQLTQKQIERDLSRGFVVVQRAKNEMTAEEKKERYEARSREEEEVKEKEKTRKELQTKRQAEREAKEAEAAKEFEGANANEQIKAILDKQQKDKDAKKASLKPKGTGQVKNFRVEKPVEEEAPRHWDVVETADYYPDVDQEDYPALHQ